MDSANTYILGISAYYHDSAACILKNGEIIAAAQEERFTRKKHDQNFPSNAIKYCLIIINLNLGMIEWLVLSAAFKAVVCSKTAELGSIPRRSR